MTAAVELEHRRQNRVVKEDLTIVRHGNVVLRQHPRPGPVPQQHFGIAIDGAACKRTVGTIAGHDGQVVLSAGRVEVDPSVGAQRERPGSVVNGD